MKMTEEMRDDVADMGVPDEAALKHEPKEKSREFTAKSAERHAKARVWQHNTRYAE